MAKTPNLILGERYKSIFNDLSDKQAGALIKAVFNYHFDLELATFSDLEIKTAFKFLKQDIDFNKAKYAEVSEIRKEAGKQGGAPQGNGNANKQNKHLLTKQAKTSKTSICDKENNKENVNVKEKDKDNIVGASAADFDVTAKPSAINAQTEYSPPDVNAETETKTAEKTTKAASVSQSEAIQRQWNEFCDLNPQLAKVLLLSDKRKLKLKARLREPPFDFDAILAAFDKQPFLKGGNKQGWIASFDWLIDNSTNYLKVLELAYNKAAAADKLTDFVKAKYAQYAETAEADAENSEAEAEIIEGG